MLTLIAPQNLYNSTIKLSGSKSIHNRLLILNEVLNLKLQFENVSNSEDTKLLKKALQKISTSNNAIIDVGHAGTDMRFLTAFLSIRKGEWVLTGSDRMKQRPIGELVKVLTKIGADIHYIEKENYPPLKIKGNFLNGKSIEIDGSISSQFISALLLISPVLKNGLELTIKNKPVSWPYVKMSIDLLTKAGIKVVTENNKIKISAISENFISNIYNSKFFIESDWSSASYWYSLVALSQDLEICLTGLKNNSTQADSILPGIYSQFGVSTQFKNDCIIIKKNGLCRFEFEYNFSDCPDIAQTVAVTCFGLGMNAYLNGLSTLKHKESDRIYATKTELEKFGALIETTDNSLILKNSLVNNNIETLKTKTFTVSTYNDHRVAMSFAPLAILCKELCIQNPEVVSKSYPLFWEDLKSVGFNVNLTR